MATYLPFSHVCALAWTLTAVAVLLTAGRFVISWRMRKWFTWCDAFNGLAAIFLVAFFACWQAYVPAEYTLALKMNEDMEANIFVWRDFHYNPYNHLNMNIATSTLYWACIYSAKATFLAMYWTIFSMDPPFRFWWNFAALYIFAAFAATIMMRFTLCGEVKHVLQYYRCQPHTVDRNMVMGIVWCILDGLGDVVLTALPFTMMSQIFLRRSQKIQLGCLFGLAGLNLATNILRTYYTVDRNLQRYAHLNAPWFILQGTLAVILCALPCYGSQITRKKPRTHDGIRVVDNSGTTHTGLCSMESFGARVDTKKDVDSVISPPRAIKVRDDLKQNADITFPDSRDRRVRHSVAIWSD